MSTPYRTGRDFEYKVRTYLQDNGYSVIRSAGSKTKVDLVAIKPGQILFVQCKRGGVLPAAEWDEILTLAGHARAVPVLAQYGGRGRGIVLTELLGPKIPRGRVQRTREFAVDEVAA